MANLSVSYLGLQLANPLIASSSGLTSTLDGIIKLADAGIGAVVLKSLFEEQIDAETRELGSDFSHSEAYDYLQQMGMSLGPQAYLALIRSAKEKVKVPVIASVNCISAKWWKEYAGQLEKSGADALEINLSLMPRRFDQKASDLEKELVSTVSQIRSATKLPMAVKLGPYFTSLPELSIQLRKAGADALVLFNRFYQFDFDPLNGSQKGRLFLSGEHDYHEALRWISILFERSGTQLSASTGVHSGETALKMIAAGADSVQLCSALYRQKLEFIPQVLDYLSKSLDGLGIGSIEEYKGTHSQKHASNPESHERLQYIKALTGVS